MNFTCHVLPVGVGVDVGLEISVVTIIKIETSQYIVGQEDYKLSHARDYNI